MGGASQSVEISSQIRRTFNSIEGLTGAVDKLPVEQRFQLANVKAVRPSYLLHCLQADPPLCQTRLYGQIPLPVLFNPTTGLLSWRFPLFSCLPLH